LQTHYCKQEERFTTTEEDFSTGVAVKLVDGLFGERMRALFENIKDKDSYDMEVSNLNKYGVGQETWDDYYSSSIAGTASTVTGRCWLVFIPALLIILFRITGLHEKPIF
jgi:hypothetical protein